MKKILLLLPVMLLIVACNNDEQQATQLYNQAQELYQAGDYVAATAVLDSLATAYPGETEVQRQALKLQCQVNQKRYERELHEVDSLYIRALAHRDSLISSNFELISEHKEQTLANYLYKGSFTTSPINKSQVRAHVNELGYLELTSIYCGGGKINHTHITLKQADGTILSSDTIPYDEALNYRYTSGGRNIELVTYKIDQCENILKAIDENPNSRITLTLSGDKSAQVTLDNKSRKAILESYYLAQAFAEVKNLESRQKFCNEQLNLANAQLSRQ